MGAVDLVVQVESPKSVATGLQRIGRAGHRLGEPSKGRIFPKFRADLLESAVVARRMTEGAIEETRIVRNPLDVLAQQVVSRLRPRRDIRRRPPRPRPGRLSLPRPVSAAARERPRHAGGRYPSEEFSSSAPGSSGTASAGWSARGRARAAWQSPTPARSLIAGSSGCTWSRGADASARLDEEMVYEARQGQTFLLGASTWRIEEITRDRVLVSPHRGSPGSSLSGRERASAGPSSSGARSAAPLASS